MIHGSCLCGGVKFEIDSHRRAVRAVPLHEVQESWRLRICRHGGSAARRLPSHLGSGLDTCIRSSSTRSCAGLPYVLLHWLRLTCAESEP